MMALWMVNYYERVAKEAAKYHLLIDFHGSFKPAGLEYRYPNILSYSKLMGALHKAGIEINRKVLADLAMNHPEAFKAVVAKAKAA